ncbi:hypothetical protein MRB53_017385 [Persea americana]|uniref:Uncharacterized protein n=1 Tax=Persea americana TaxID=3435 RepID=A0ACC2M4J0_PERAE|nr:hypothetical protein MRB53_017385 [Persea americana]
MFRISLIPSRPLQLLIPQPPNQRTINLIKISPFTEEVLNPQKPTAPQNPIHIIQQELHRHCRNPPIHGVPDAYSTMPTPYKIHNPIKDWELLRERHVEGDEALESNRLVVVGTQIHGRGDGGDIVELHSSGEGAGAAAHVEGEVEDGGGILGNIVVEAGEAGEALAGVGGPEDGGIWEGEGEGRGRERGGGFRWGGREAATAGKGVTGAEDEGVVGRVEGEGGVVHEAVEEVGVVAAGGSNGGEAGVEEEIGGNGRWGVGGVSGGCGGGAEVGEVVDGGVDGGELVEEVVGYGGGGGWVRQRTVLLRGGEVVEGEDVGGYHGHKK